MVLMMTKTLLPHNVTSRTVPESTISTISITIKVDMEMNIMKFGLVFDVMMMLNTVTTQISYEMMI